MATTILNLPIDAAGPVPGETLPEFASAGSSLGAATYKFDAAATEAIQWQVGRILAYGSGNLTVRLYWYGDTATSGDVVWGVSIAAVTSDTDAQDAETDAWATENTATDSHLGTTAQRWHTATVTVSNLDGLVNGDLLWVRVRRIGGNGSDTMSGDAQLGGVSIEYSDS